ncbi:MAG: hypothetical protein ACRC35_02240 [Angustibacter sp.]
MGKILSCFSARSSSIVQAKLGHHLSKRHRGALSASDVGCALREVVLPLDLRQSALARLVQWLGGEISRPGSGRE